MLKKIVMMVSIVGVMGLYGADYTGMSTDELLGLRGTPKTQQEREALHNELQKRYMHMTPEQKQKFNTSPGKGMKGQGQGMKGQGQGKKGGQGMKGQGQGKKGGQGQGMKGQGIGY